jgi:hypothetical protein
MIIRCHACRADPAGRWKPPPAAIFHDFYAKGASEEALDRDTSELDTLAAKLSEAQESVRDVENKVGDLLVREASAWPKADFGASDSDDA